MLDVTLKSLAERDYERCDGRDIPANIVDIETLWISIDKNYRKILQDDSPITLGFNLEDYMCVLPKKYLLAYIIAAMTNFFHEKRNGIYIHDTRYGMDKDCIYIINHIKTSLLENTEDNYYLNVSQSNIYLPWNDYIVPSIAELMEGMRTQFMKPSTSAKKPDTISKDKIRYAVHNILKKDKDFMEQLRSEEVERHFIDGTSKVAVSFNGTACAGKTSTLYQLQNEIIGKLNRNCQIEKVGRYGGFRGKDGNQILALTYQGIMLNIAHRYPSNLLDRDPFNNLIWRLILQFIKTYKDESNLEDEIVEVFYKSVSGNLLQIMKQYPVIIIIDLDEISNRKKMFERKTGGDRKRCYITNYVKMQNVFYSLFAYFCKWPVYNRAFSTETRKKIIKLVMLKIEQNPRNPPQIGSQEVDLKASVKFESDHKEDFKAAIKVNIMK